MGAFKSGEKTHRRIVGGIYRATILLQNDLGGFSIVKAPKIVPEQKKIDYKCQDRSRARIFGGWCPGGVFWRLESVKYKYIIKMFYIYVCKCKYYMYVHIVRMPVCLLSQ